MPNKLIYYPFQFFIYFVSLWLTFICDQWLVKKAIETKEEMGDLNRLFSVSQFNKRNKLPEDKTFDSVKQTSMSTMQNIRVRLLHLFT